MSSPILHLYGDVWTQISHYLDFESFANLLAVGSAPLSSTIRQSAHVAQWRPSGPILDFEAFLRACHKVQVTSISVHSDLIIVKKPLEPLILPHNLTSLDLNFRDCSTMISPLPLSTMVPNLRHLVISCTSTTASRKIQDFDLPPNLEVLSLLFHAYSLLQPHDVAKLPRGLTSLTLRANMNWNDGLKPQVTNDASYDWPAALSSFCLSCSQEVVIEHLPRTASKLEFHFLPWSADARLVTNFPQSTPFDFPVVSDSRIAFPWRRFFPHLVQLYLRINRGGSNSRFLPSVILPNVFDVAEVERFISSGFWDIPSLRSQPGAKEQSFPLYKTIEVPDGVWSMNDKDLTNQLTLLAPYIANIDFARFSGFSSASTLLPATRSVHLLNIFDGTTLPFPPTATLINVHRAKLSMMPPTLTSLHSSKIVGSEDGGALGPTDCFPPTLVCLTLQRDSEQPKFCSILPLSLTDLSMDVSTPEDWSLVAERLVNLRRLTVTVRFNAEPGARIAPIASPRLNYVCLVASSEIKPAAGQPRLSCFFSKETTVFPASLRDMHLGAGLWHCSILAVLPPSLTSLHINLITWGAEKWEETPYPGCAGLSPADLLQRLPPGLQTLGLDAELTPVGQKMAGPVKPSIELIKLLPRTLRSAQLGSAFHNQDKLSVRSLAALLPPTLTYLGSSVVRIETTDLRPQGFFN